MSLVNNTLFNPARLNLPKNLILIPQFWDQLYYQKLQIEAVRSLEMIQSEILFFENYALVTGFLGYPHILTLLEFIQNVREKNIYFLGTAGSLNETIDTPMPLCVEEIYSTEILEHFSPEKSYSLRPLNTGTATGNAGDLSSTGSSCSCSLPLRKARGVTVDIIQRETVPWFHDQVKRNIDFVEMEIFPLRVYLGKPFTAIVVTSDLLRESGISVFKDKQKLRKEFVYAYELILKDIATACT